jgi:4-amino-4-deoxy-L-arabinose transferase-like glycosyltransferase
MHVGTRASFQGQATLAEVNGGSPDRKRPGDGKPMMPGFVAGDATYRTRRRQIAVAAATAAIAVVLAIGPLFRERDRLAYTNNVPARAVATATDPGGRMCRSGVYMPADATGVRLYALTYGRPGPPLAFTFRSPGGTSTSKIPGGYPDQKYVVIPIARPDVERTGTLCVRNIGSARVAFGGVGYNTTAGSRLTVDGRKQPGDLAIEMTAGRGSLLGLAPTIFERATVWAPPWVGRWTYYLLVVVALTLAVAAVRLVLVRGNPFNGRNSFTEQGRPKAEVGYSVEEPAGRGPLRLPRAAWGIATVAVVNGLIWAVLVPPWQAPDEIAHFAYTQYFAETGNASVDPHATSNYSTEQQYAMENGLTNTYRNNPRGRPPWRQVDRRMWEQRDASTHPSRSNGGGAPSLNYTPEYYALSAVGYYAFDWGDIFDRLFGVRLVSVLLGGLSTLFVWLFARELFQREGFLPNTAALVVALLPEFGFISGVVNNDNLLVMFACLELYLLARSVRRGLTLKLAVLIGVVLGLGYLAKPSMAAFGPVVAGVLAWPAIRARDVRLLKGAVAAFAGFAAIAATWSVVAALSNRGVTTVTTANAHPFSLHDYLSYIFHFYVPGTDKWFGTATPVYSVWMHSFFATFGWSDTLFPDRTYRVLTLLCVGVAVLLGIAAWRERRAARRALPIIVIGAASVLLLLLLLHLAFYLNFAGYPGEQGRYLLPLVPLFGAALAASTLALGRRHAPLLAAFYVTAFACFTLFSYGLELTRYYS